MEPETGFEPVTAALRKQCSTTELLWRRSRALRAGENSEARPFVEGTGLFIFHLTSDNRGRLTLERPITRLKCRPECAPC